MAGTAIDPVADIGRHHGWTRLDRVAPSISRGARLSCSEPGYKAPRSIDFIGALPCNPIGEIPKRELRKPYWKHRERQVHE